MQKAIVIFLLLSIVTVQAEKAQIIFDTDMNGDVDDVGALAVLHGLADLGEADILACMSSNPGPYVCECIDVINTYYGRPDIPIGALRGARDNGYYTKALADNYPHDATRLSLPEPVALYRQILAEQPDTSVTIVSVGYLPNLGQLLRSEADEKSEKNGLELVEAKVKLWVCMGGVFPSGSEHNLTFLYPEEAQYAIEHWPTRILFTGWEIGKEIMTGFEAHKYFKNSPVTLAYQLYFCSWAFDGNPYYAWYHGHYSWDLTAVLLGVRGFEEYWDTVETGYNAIADDGSNEWRDSPDKDHAFVVPKKSNAEIAGIIDGLLNLGPIGAHFFTSGNIGWLPHSVEFDASISNAGQNSIVSHDWDLGNGVKGSSEQMSTVYESAGVYPVQLTVTDNEGMTYQTADTVIVSDPLFSPVPHYGNAKNFEQVNPALWSTKFDGGNLRYFLNNAPRNPDDTFNGYSFIKDSSFTDFTLQFRVRTAEDWELNRAPDYGLVWGYTDENNYTSIQMGKRKTRLINYKNGERTNLERSLLPGLPDDSWHRITLVRSQDHVTIMIDGETFLSVQDPVLAAAGRIGFGSKDEAVYFDDINASRSPTSVEGRENRTAIVDHVLGQNYPNPFNPVTTIPFKLTKAGFVKVEIYNIAGHHIKTLVNGKRDSGRHIVRWNAANNPSGVYIVKMKTGDVIKQQKIMLLK